MYFNNQLVISPLLQVFNYDETLEITLCTRMMDTCYYIFTQAQRKNHHVNYRLCRTLMCQCRLISCNKYTTLLGNIGNGRGYTYVGSEGIWEFLYLPLNFAIKLKLINNKEGE
jgi:hypothetical protein